MHPKFSPASALTHEVIAAAIEVHRTMGAGLLESIYEWCLTQELSRRGFPVQTQKMISIHYKGSILEQGLKFDLLVNDCLLVEIKAVEKVLPIHKAQLLSYMKLLDVPVGLLLNFHVTKLTDGVSRMMLPNANRGECPE